MFEGSVEILIAFVAVLAAVGVVTMIIRAMNVPIVAAATIGVTCTPLAGYRFMARLRANSALTWRRSHATSQRAIASHGRAAPQTCSTR